MNPNSDAGVLARLIRVEQDVARNSERLRTLDVVGADVRNIREDIADLKTAVGVCSDDAQKIRGWVEERIEAEKKSAAADSLETRKLRTSEKIALYSVAGTIIAAIIAAIAALSAAGALS